MKRIFGKTILLFLIITLAAYSASFYLPQYQSLGNDFNPPTPAFESFRITNVITESDEFNIVDQDITRFIEKWGIVGASVSIAKDNRLVYAKGYGFADKEQGVKTEPYNLFRVASVSKLITAVAIMKLVEHGQLALTTKVFGPTGILNDSLFLTYKDPRVEEITVRQLLEHSAGWTTRYGDHMFMPQTIAQKLNKPLPVSVDDIICFALSFKLHFQPGSYSSYSNLGYAVLGRVIEKVSGVDYESFVKSEVLSKLGIYDMRLGGSYLSERAEFEVKYYEPSPTVMVEDYTGKGEMVPRCYGGNDIKTLGAAGGWIASSTDLMKLMLAIDGNNYYADILHPQSIEWMTTPDNLQKSPLGWRYVKPGFWVRTGTLAGTSALMVNRMDGVSYVVVVNTGSWMGPEFNQEIMKSMEKSINKLKEWPSFDLFELSRQISLN
jgi:CubicO group peptidase (beta-lactamase class C family)